MAEPAASFDPRELPTRQMGARGDYMDVKWRLVWLRREHPDATIDSEQLLHTPNEMATFKAVVSIPGGGRATGHGSETKGDFGDYYEKAETKAIGRALSGLGYGTQFLPDDGEALADSPVERSSGQAAPKNARPNPPVSTQSSQPSASGPASNALPATDRQIKFVQAIASDKGLSDEDVRAETWRLYEKSEIRDLTRGEASAFLDVLQAKDAAGQPGREPTPINRAQNQGGVNLAAVHAAFQGKVEGDPHKRAHALAEAVYGVPSMRELRQEQADQMRKAMGECRAPQDGEALIALAIRFNAATSFDELNGVSKDVAASGFGPARLDLMRAAKERARDAIKLTAEIG